jgi:hypothetical protein
MTMQPNLPSGITMTYAELADVRGIDRASAERLVRRRKWPRQVGNDGVVRVIVPLTDVQKSSKEAALGDVRPISGPGLPADDVTPTSALISDPGQLRSVPRIIETLKSAVDALRSQLERERSRVDQAERLLDEERGQSGKLQASLADAVAAERIAAGAAAALRAELDRRQKWGFLRRLWWALRCRQP